MVRVTEKRLLGLRGQRKALRDALRATDRDPELTDLGRVHVLNYALAGGVLAVMDYLIAEHMDGPVRDYEKAKGE